MRTLLALVAVLVVSLLVTEATMQPSSTDRTVLLVIFTAVALLTGAAAWWVPRRARRFRSLRTTVLVVAIAAILVAALSVVLSAGLMFFSAHDLRLGLVSAGLGLALGVVLAVAVAGPLSSDLDRLRRTAERVAGGDLEARTGIDRPDEVGDVARAMDVMVARLAAAEQQRAANEASRREFLAAIGHDLRTPLTALQATIEALRDGVAPDPDRYLRSMERDIEAMRALVEDLFTLARLESGELRIDPEPVDIAELADAAVEAMTPVARRHGVRLRLEGEQRLPAQGGPAELTRVLRNLLDNAVRHAPEGSEVVVRVANGSGAATVRVEDQGPGFPDAFRGVALESFTRADPARTRMSGGAGLGLAIARGIVELHGGEIWIEDGPGGRVAFRLPS